ncbi:hypothetical protein D3C72_1939950 [compost metagenome]
MAGVAPAWTVTLARVFSSLTEVRVISPAVADTAACRPVSPILPFRAAASALVALSWLDFWIAASAGPVAAPGAV